MDNVKAYKYNYSTKTFGDLIGSPTALYIDKQNNSICLKNMGKSTITEMILNGTSNNGHPYYFFVDQNGAILPGEWGSAGNGQYSLTIRGNILPGYALVLYQEPTLGSTTIISLASIKEEKICPAPIPCVNDCTKCAFDPSQCPEPDWSQCPEPDWSQCPEPDWSKCPEPDWSKCPEPDWSKCPIIPCENDCSKCKNECPKCECPECKNDCTKCPCPECKNDCSKCANDCSKCANDCSKCTVIPCEKCEQKECPTCTVIPCEKCVEKECPTCTVIPCEKCVDKECPTCTCPECTVIPCTECKDKKCPDCEKVQCPECEQTKCAECEVIHCPDCKKCDSCPKLMKPWMWIVLLVLVLLFAVLIYKKYIVFNFFNKRT